MSSDAATWLLERGDCLDLMRSRPSASVDLVYLDPPFFTGRTLRGRTRADGFDDRWSGVEAYLGFLRERLMEAHRLLRATGSILLHCDWRTCHHLRLELDAIFGVECAVNHLIWSYGLGGSGPRSFARKHDDILLYGRTTKYWFQAPRVASRSRRMAGATKKATDVIEIPSINNMAHERTGWPSQKPLALLSLLIDACAMPGGIVLDPFCGSGTTLVAALQSGRSGIGMDRSARAIAISRQRLTQTAASAESIKVSSRRRRSSAAPASAVTTVR